MAVLNRDHTPGSVAQTEFSKSLEVCIDDFRTLYAECARKHSNFDVPFLDFREAVSGAIAKYLGPHFQDKTLPIGKLKSFIAELKALDLYLALACMRGNEQAWWEFDRQHRSFIERWARHLVPTGADEVIDKVYVELFGTKVIDGVRQSKFKTYSGKGSLRGWLRTVICHAAIDLHRAPKLEMPMEDWADCSDESVRPDISADNAEESMLNSVVRQKYRSAALAALDQALTALDDHETLLLLYYHVEGLKLREIARIVEQPQSPMRRWFQRRSPRGGSRPQRVHESTVMRWLEKVYRKVSERFQYELSTSHGLNPDEIEICKEIAAEDQAHTITIPAATGARDEKESSTQSAS